MAQILANLKATKEQLEQLQAKFNKVEEENKKLSSLHSTKDQLEQLQAKFQRVEEENKKLADQLKQAVAKNNERPVSVKVEPVKTEPVKTEPAKTEPNMRPVSARYQPTPSEPAKSYVAPSYSVSAKTEPPRPSSAKTEPAKSEPKPAAKNTFGPVSYVPAPNSAPFRNFKIPAKTTTPTTTPTPTPTTTATPVKTEIKTTPKVETTKTETLQAPSSPSSQRPGSAFGPRYLKNMGANAEQTDYSEPKAKSSGMCLNLLRGCAA